VAVFHASSEKLDSLGRVVDFGVLKERLGGWIEQHWDHGFLCERGDEEVMAALRTIPGQKLFVLDASPTAENMAAYLLNVVGPQQLAGTGVRLVRVELWETENCRADVTA
jgi:6-pyruvoyltetrahydropterin/6-carboxytetrahydropterin synthase